MRKHPSAADPGGTVETFKRIVAVVLGLFLLAGGVAGWLVGDQPDPEMAGQVLTNVLGAILGTGVAWIVKRQKGEPLTTKPVILWSIGGACTLWLALSLAQGGQGLLAALGSGLGGGLMAGAILAMVVYGIRGPVEGAEAEDEGEYSPVGG